MRKFLLVVAGAAAGFVPLQPGLRAQDGPSVMDQLAPFFATPGPPDLPFPMPWVPGTRTGPVPGVTGPLTPLPAPKPAVAAKPQTRAEVLDDLFARLAGADDADEASGIASRIQRVWLDSGSATADLLMSRAATVMASGKRDVALNLVDKIVLLDPDWAEGWNKRATLRFLDDDDFGSMEDLTHVLTLEPRHFGALNGMGMILQRHGMKKEALAILRRAAEIYPRNTDLTRTIDELTPEVEGRPI